jgi:DNA-binding response OmpR family regulator
VRWGDGPEVRARAARSLLVEGASVGTATILVVDDERKIRDLVRSYLEREGYAVLVADTGQRALEAIERARPDLVVLDLMLPDLPGEEVARSVRAHSDLPIIMLTAKAGEDDRVAGLRLGADDYLPKPFSPRELVARVEAVLRRARGAPERDPSPSTGAPS